MNIKNIKSAVSSQKNVRTNDKNLLVDLKLLLKGPVLIANVLPVFTGFWLALFVSNASFYEYFDVFVFTIIGSTLVMAGALVLNNWYDADIDAIMSRTKQRPTVTGNISLKTVLIIGITLTLLGFLFLFFTTVGAIFYAFIGWFTYVFLYTMWSKRKYTLNTVVGSVSGAVTPLIGWAAIAPSNHIIPIILFSILFIWQMPHTFAIAMRKYEEYKAAGVAMLPVVRGFKMTKRQILVYVACLLPLPFYLHELGIVFVAIATVLNLTWLGISVYGLFTKDDQKYAYVSFLYSVNYISILYVFMILVTMPVFK
ncbi:protoheme IX farnesyltransferase [Anaerobacillus arseniciselenatis]|uniref:Protoheme IX farnesyltransferase n=1 Tax=Anaerobacillus arseniciselenatis TaxID=85682 RepID=A0A1S2LAH6_9BACI|nr:heme o synthase [Anaerobacillus arseniciselenatis]OIJ09324.1 protoheme IX farnesyltransferase [Anaerobacillus arseniciselenatis]